jgi:tetratricopeptide (TPR) repeat protein
MTRTIEDVVETLKDAKKRGRKCVLLIGAGCSVSGGIPRASDFVAEIESRYPAAYRRVADNPTYPACMAALPYDARRSLIAGFVDNARINWAHICIAQLMQHDYVDSVLTTNFDPLLIRACALLGIIPAIYDLAASQQFDPAYLDQPSILYLHGQRFGPVLLNTEAECTALSASLAPMFGAIGRNRVWIVVGYSGVNDPVFEHLAAIPRFDNYLYWVGYKDNPPADHIQHQLLDDARGAFHVPGFDADEFFVVATQQLGIFPPSFVNTPFTYLDQRLDSIVPYVLPDARRGTDAADPTNQEDKEASRGSPVTDSMSNREITEPTRRLVRAAIEQFETRVHDGTAQDAEASTEVLTREQILRTLAFANFTQGNALLEGARRSRGKERDALYTAAIERFDSTLRVLPQAQEALNNWGIALLEWSRVKPRIDATRLLAQARERFQAVLIAAPQDAAAHTNMGLVLSDLARLASGAQALQMFEQAVQEHTAALSIEPTLTVALTNLAITLYEYGEAEADNHHNQRADELFAQATARFHEALEHGAGSPDLYNMLGNALSERAKLSVAKDCDSLYQQAVNAYESAIMLDRRKHQAFYNWGNALYDQALGKSDEDTLPLLDSAAEKYESAIAIDPGKVSAYNNLGNVLSKKATLIEEQDRDAAIALVGRAMNAYEKAEMLVPGESMWASNVSSTLHQHALLTDGPERASLLAAAAQRAGTALQRDSANFRAWVNLAAVRLEQAKAERKSRKRKQRLTEARRAGQRAEQLRPGAGAYTLACVSALQGNADDCKKWLERAKGSEFWPDGHYAASDEDFAAMRALDWFITLTADDSSAGGNTTITEPCTDF